MLEGEDQSLSGALNDDSIDSGNLGDGGDRSTELKKPVFDYAQALAYLKSKGLEYESFDQLTNQRNSVSGLTKKNQELLKTLGELRRNPKYAELLESGLSGQPGASMELPQELAGLKPDIVKLLEVAVKHHAKPLLDEIRKELKSEFQGTLSYRDALSKHADLKDNEAEFMEYLDKLGVKNLDEEGIDDLYGVFLSKKGKAQPDIDKPGVSKQNFRRIGITPKASARIQRGGAVKDMADAETDEEVKAVLDAHYEGGGG